MTQRTPSQVTPRLVERSQDYEIDLGYLFAVCWDHRKLISTITSLCTLLGIAYALLASPVYRADALLQVEKQQGSMINQELQFLMGQEGAASSTQTEILRSRMILGQASEQEGLDLAVEPNYFPLVGKALVRFGVKRPDFAEGWNSVWAGESITVSTLIVEPSLYGTRLILRVAEDGRYKLEDEDGKSLGEGRVGESLNVEVPAIELRVVRVDAPAQAEFALIKRSPADAIEYIQNRFSVSERGRESGILELGLTGEDPNEIANTLNAIGQVFLIQNINRQAAEAENRLAFLEQQAPEIRTALTHSENQLNSYRAEQESVDLSFETQSMLQSLVQVESKINELELRESELAERFTSSHPAYRTLLEQKIQLKAEQARLERQVEGLPETQQEVLRLNRDVEVTQQIYMQLLNTMQELRIARAGTIGNVRILDEALVAPDAIAPRRTLVIVSSLLAGLLLALMVLTVRRVAHRGIESADQLGELGLAVYATVPLSRAQVTMLSDRQKRESMSSQLKIWPLVRSDRRKRDRETVGGILAWLNPADLSIEALRSLRTSLHFAMLESGNNRLMLTGPSPGVGKSFVSINLAAVCAQAGQKVLLIDADLRKGHIHTAFKDDNTKGLTDLLAGRADAASSIRCSEQEGLYYIPRGKAPPNPSELLMQQNFTRFLDEVSAQYDLIIIDTPPVLAVTDAAVVGKQCGSTLMIIRFQVNPPKEVERSLQALDSAGVVVKGAILNGIERSATTNYGYGYGYYNYAYKAERE